MINKNETSALDKANKIYSELEKNNIESIIDDTDENFSSKIKKMNLIGAPYQIIIGKNSDGDLLEFKEIGKDTLNIKLSEIIKNDTQIRFSDEHIVRFNTTKDLENDFTQFYKLSYEYETDCLLASFEYQKKFFRDGSLMPDESLVFLIKFIPFAEVRGAANSVFEN